MEKSEIKWKKIAVIAIILIVGLAWYFNDQNQTRIANCAMRTQDTYLEVHYRSKGIQPTPDDLLETYREAKADCGG